MDYSNMFDEIENSARERHIPVILDDSKDELLALVTKIKPKRILEIGTAIGYSGSLMLDIAKDCVLDTVELLEDRREEALSNFKMLPQIIKGNIYDLVFIDGPKSKYTEYLNMVLGNIKKGGYVFCDNVLFRGMVASGNKPPHKYRTIVVSLRNFLKYIADNSDFRTEIKEKGDGIAIIEVIK